MEPGTYVQYFDLGSDFDISSKPSFEIAGTVVFYHEFIAFFIPWVMIVLILLDIDPFSLITAPLRCFCSCLCCCRCCGLCGSSSNNSSNDGNNNQKDRIVDLQAALVPFVPQQSDHPLPADLTKSTDVFASIDWPVIPTETAELRSELLYEFMNSRRSVRMFDPINKPPLSVLENCVKTAGTAPSGAHQQPWHFVIVQSADVKSQIRELVEREEEKNYRSRMNPDWLKDVNSMVGNLHSNHPKEVVKPYLTDAPYLIVALKQVYGLPKPEVDWTKDETDDAFYMSAALKSAANGDDSKSQDEKEARIKHWYATESCGLACGVLISALHNANLATLPSTPMGADSEIRRICQRPDNEKVFLLLPVGYPSQDCSIPYRTLDCDWRKPLSELYSVV